MEFTTLNPASEMISPARMKLAEGVCIAAASSSNSWG
jgi:hypothetical protein